MYVKTRGEKVDIGKKHSSDYKTGLHEIQQRDSKRSKGFFFNEHKLQKEHLHHKVWAIFTKKVLNKIAKTIIE